MTYADGTMATVDQEAHDVVTFLSWAADPKMEERKRIGFNVMVFLLVLASLLYFSYQRALVRPALTSAVPIRDTTRAMTKTVLGIIGGSGVYDISGLEDARWQRVNSPWGEPSDDLLFGTLDGVDMVFLPRHGRGHVHSPTSINYRANIDALKRAGCTDVISVSACGSFREDLPPGTSCSPTSSSTAPLPARRASSAAALSPMFRWPIRSVRAWSAALNEAARAREDRLPARRHLPRDGGAAILHPGRSRGSIAPGVAT